MQGPRFLDRRISRRRALAAGVSLAAGAVAFGATGCDPAIMRRVHQIEGRRDPRHSVWVWQFSVDGAAHDIAATLASYGLAVMVKTHDGVEWMATYDDAADAIGGPGGVEHAAAIFEGAGVPFHAWSVVKGTDPVLEAQMASDVLSAGARSLTLDLEESDSFWSGTTDDALRFCSELRALQPNARIDISIDPRPWKMRHIPLHEFVEYTDGIRPQLYWDLFNDIDHANAYSYLGLHPVDGSITPDFLVEATSTLLAPLDRWIVPVAPGALGTLDAFSRFHRRSWELQMPEVSVWRYGTTDHAVLQHLADHPPSSEPPVA